MRARLAVHRLQRPMEGDAPRDLERRRRQSAGRLRGRTSRRGVYRGLALRPRLRRRFGDAEGQPGFALDGVYVLRVYAQQAAAIVEAMEQMVKGGRVGGHGER